MPRFFGKVYELPSFWLKVSATDGVDCFEMRFLKLKKINGMLTKFFNRNSGN